MKLCSLSRKVDLRQCSLVVADRIWKGNLFVVIAYIRGEWSGVVRPFYVLADIFVGGACQSYGNVISPN